MKVVRSQRQREENKIRTSTAQLAISSSGTNESTDGGNFMNENFRNLYFVFFYFYLYIYPPDSQESDGGAIHRVSNYPNLLPEIPRYCCPLLI